MSLQLLAGKTKSLPKDCVAYTTGMTNKDFDTQRIVVLGYNAEKERWATRLWDPKWNGKEILVKDGNIKFDLWVSKEAPKVPAGVDCKGSEGKEDGLYAAKDFKKDAVVMQDAPLMLVNNQTDGFTARWNCYFYEEREKGKVTPVLKSFDEITTGGLVEEYLDDARKVFQKIVTVGCGESEWNQMNGDPKGKAFIQQEARKISGVLTRWQANSHDFPLAGRPLKETSGLFRWGSKINHSCEPNCVWDVDIATGNLVVKAIRAIQKGEELTCSYMSKECLDKEFVQRRKEIKLFRTFICTCTRCLREYEVEKRRVADNVAKMKSDAARAEASPEESPEDFYNRVRQQSQEVIDGYEASQKKAAPAPKANPSGGYQHSPQNGVKNGSPKKSEKKEEEEEAPKICEVDDEEAERILEEKRNRNKK